MPQWRLAREPDFADSDVWRTLNSEHTTRTATIDCAARRLGKGVRVTLRKAS
jgi:hypothetical protein